MQMEDSYLQQSAVGYVVSPHTTRVHHHSVQLQRSLNVPTVHTGCQGGIHSDDVHTDPGSARRSQCLKHLNPNNSFPNWRISSGTDRIPSHIELVTSCKEWRVFPFQSLESKDLESIANLVQLLSPAKLHNPPSQLLRLCFGTISILPPKWIHRICLWWIELCFPFPLQPFEFPSLPSLGQQFFRNLFLLCPHIL